MKFLLKFYLSQPQNHSARVDDPNMCCVISYITLRPTKSIYQHQNISSDFFTKHENQKHIPHTANKQYIYQAIKPKIALHCNCSNHQVRLVDITLSPAWLGFGSCPPTIKIGNSKAVADFDMEGQLQIVWGNTLDNVM